MGDQLEKPDTTNADVLAFVEQTSSTLEIAGFGQSTKSPAYKVSSPQTSALPKGVCDRCGRSGHQTEECFANRHKKGYRLDNSTHFAQPPSSTTCQRATFAKKVAFHMPHDSNEGIVDTITQEVEDITL